MDVLGYVNVQLMPKVTIIVTVTILTVTHNRVIIIIDLECHIARIATNAPAILEQPRP